MDLSGELRGLLRGRKGGLCPCADPTLSHTHRSETSLQPIHLWGEYFQAQCSKIGEVTLQKKRIILCRRQLTGRSALCRGEDCSAWLGAGGPGGAPSCRLHIKPHPLTKRQEEGIRQLAHNFYTSLFPKALSSSWLGPGYFPFLLPAMWRTMENHPLFSASLLKK